MVPQRAVAEGSAHTSFLQLHPFHAKIDPLHVQSRTGVVQETMVQMALYSQIKRGEYQYIAVSGVLVATRQHDMN
jgi:hypothetical protein